MNPYEEINREPSSKGNPYLTLNDAPKLKAEDNPYAKINDVPKLNNASQVESNPYLKLNDATSEESSGPIHSIVGALREHIVNPLKETGNTVLDYLSYLDRPRNALAVGTKEYQRA